MKAILVMDMPECCADCPCSFFERSNPKLNLICGVTQEDANNVGKPDWCPLRPAPEKRQTTNDFWQGCVNIVRNHCIDEILGDKE